MSEDNNNNPTMDVLNATKPPYGLFRRRLRVQTPEINTYHKQILLCEKNCDEISKKFYNPEVDNENKNYGRLSLQCPLAGGNTTNKSASKAGRGEPKQQQQQQQQQKQQHHYIGNNRRRSDPQTQQSISYFKRSSIASPTPRQKRHGSLHSRSCSIERIVIPRGSASNIHQFRRTSRRQSEMERIELVKEHNSVKSPGNHNNITGKPDGDFTSSALEEISSDLHRERHHFLRALTTLAINRMTADNDSTVPTPVDRNTTFTNYERNINVLADTPRSTDLDGHTLPPNHFNNYQDLTPETSSSTGTSDLYDLANDDTIEHLDKRQRINRLRNYLKRSGVGDPNVITTTNERCADDKQAFHRLIRRINRGVSFEKHDRLRRKARLDYEMCLMKGESFCEQQEQAYMRTASADMENRDIQLLEEELKIHALQEIRQNNKETNKKQDAINGRRNMLKKQSSSFEILKQNDEVVGDGGEAAIREEGESKQEEGDEKCSSDGRADALSGLIRHPLSRNEMRKRILLWINDVEDATGAQSNQVSKYDNKAFSKAQQNRQSAIVNQQTIRGESQ